MIRPISKGIPRHELVQELIALARQVFKGAYSHEPPPRS
jgi:hypothetical protein